MLGLISYTLKVDLSQPPSEGNLFLFKSENKGNNVPRNTVKKGNEFNLFERALETERHGQRKNSHFLR